jgi:hypothetical protein
MLWLTQKRIEARRRLQQHNILIHHIIKNRKASQKKAGFG